MVSLLSLVLSSGQKDSILRIIKSTKALIHSIKLSSSGFFGIMVSLRLPAFVLLTGFSLGQSLFILLD